MDFHALAGGVVACWLGFAPEAGEHKSSTFLVQTTHDSNFERENNDGPSDFLGFLGAIFNCSHGFLYK